MLLCACTCESVIIHICTCVCLAGGSLRSGDPGKCCSPERSTSLQHGEPRETSGRQRGGTTAEIALD